ncbi:hypothetical protein LCGC14_0585140 [marine sediment metagenome]|uniref:Uncharacterized protein n=1 Tax=marine sediment metagenome TaxID=412755 RepID=A0A0F9RYY1_9ZZZZ
MAFKVLDFPRRREGQRVVVGRNFWRVESTHRTKAAAVQEGRKRDRTGAEFKHFAAVPRLVGFGSLQHRGEWMIVSFVSTENPFKGFR